MTRVGEVALIVLWTWAMYLYLGLVHLVSFVFEPTALGIIAMIALYFLI